MVDNWYQGLQIFNTGLIVGVLMPMKAAYLGMPVIATFVFSVLIIIGLENYQRIQKR